MHAFSACVQFSYHATCQTSWTAGYRKHYFFAFPTTQSCLGSHTLLSVKAVETLRFQSETFIPTTFLPKLSMKITNILTLFERLNSKRKLRKQQVCTKNLMKVSMFLEPVKEFRKMWKSQHAYPGQCLVYGASHYTTPCTTVLDRLNWPSAFEPAVCYQFSEHLV